MKRRIISLIALLLPAMASVQSVHAATITVVNTNDSGAGSLRQAFVDANDGDTIDFSVTTPATITLTSGELLVNKSVTIAGPGADQLSVNGPGTNFYAPARVIHISSGKTVAISGLTVTNGFMGGSGGGIYNDHATLTVTNCTLSGNFANIQGGGIYNDHATLTVTNCTLSGNSNDFEGGGIFNGGTLTVTNSTFSGNSALVGGAIFNGGTLTVTNSTLSGNSAGPDGGGIFNSATLTINNSTLSGNSAGSFGGGIYNDGVGGSATLTIGDTILKTGALGTNIFNQSGTVTSLGYNLSSDGAEGLLTATGDQINTDPMLDSLQDNGGPTFTHALLTGSAAIDMGDPNFTPPPDYDQRGPGYLRVVNGGIDIGAFEVQASSPCPQPKGYWKNNPDAWPVNSLTLGSQTYTKTELLNILATPIGTGPKADASLILADQLIAAKLNIANGSDDPAPVPATIIDADAVFSLYPSVLPYRVRTNSTNGQRMVNDAATLESYNKSTLTPGCTP